MSKMHRRKKSGGALGNTFGGGSGGCSVASGMSSAALPSGPKQRAKEKPPSRGGSPHRSLRYRLSLRRIVPASPTSPVPSRSKLAGSGTGVTVKGVDRSLYPPL